MRDAEQIAERLVAQSDGRIRVAVESHGSSSRTWVHGRSVITSMPPPPTELVFCAKDDERSTGCGVRQKIRPPPFLVGGRRLSLPECEACGNPEPNELAVAS